MARTVTYKFKGDTGQLKRSLKSLQGQMESLGKKAKSVGRQLSIYVTAPLVAAGAAAIKFAGDAEATASKINVVFGEASEDITKWAETTGNATGTATQDLLSFAATMGDTLVPMGVAPDRAAEMSKAFGELGADIAAFNNESPSETFANLRRAMTGSAESVMQYGIDVRQSAVNQELLNMGLEGGTKSASRAQKAIARLNIITRESSDAQGAAADRANTFNGQMATLRSNVKDLAVEFGNVLLPVAKDIVEITNDLVEFFEDLDDTTKDVAVAFAILAGAIGPVLFTFGVLTTTVIPALIAGYSSLATAATTAWAAITGPVGVVVATVATVGLVVYDIIDEWDVFKEYFVDLFERLVDVVGGSVDAITGAFGAGFFKVRSVVQRALRFITQKFADFFDYVPGASTLASTFEDAADGMTEAIDRAEQNYNESIGRMEEGAARVGSAFARNANQSIRESTGIDPIGPQSVERRTDVVIDAARLIGVEPGELDRAIGELNAVADEFERTTTVSSFDEFASGRKQLLEQLGFQVELIQEFESGLAAVKFTRDMPILEFIRSQQRQVEEEVSSFEIPTTFEDTFGPYLSAQERISGMGLPGSMPLDQDTSIDIPQQIEQVNKLTEAQRRRFEQEQRARAKRREARILASQALKATKIATNELSNAIGDGLAQAIFEGGNAFVIMGDLAKNVLQDLTAQLVNLVAKALLLKGLTAALGGTGIGNFFGLASSNTGFFSGIQGPTSGGAMSINIEPKIIPSGDLTFGVRQGNADRNRLGRG